MLVINLRKVIMRRPSDAAGYEPANKIQKPTR